MPTTFGSDQLLTLNAARGLFPGDARPDLSTIYRWCIDGCRGVKLKYVRVGRRMLTSREALDEFSRALTTQDGERLRNGAPAAKTPRRSAKRARAKWKPRKIRSRERGFCDERPAVSALRIVRAERGALVAARVPDAGGESARSARRSNR